MNSFFEVLRGGINSTFQDLGRRNYYHIGLPLSGAMDTRNFLISNALVGNDKEDACLEFAYQGPLLKVKNNSINIIAEGLASKIIHDISGDKLNESSIKAVVSDTSKRKIGEYL